MACRGRLFAALIAGLTLSGCLAPQSPETPGKLPMSRDTPFILDVPETDNHSTTARFQQADMPGPPQPPANSVSPPPAPAAPPVQGMPPPPGQSGPPAQGLQTVSHSMSSNSTGAVHVRAWVNGKPIFEDEIYNIVGPQLRRVYAEMSPAQRDAEAQKLINKAIDDIIENELLMQDAMRVLEKNPKLLEKLKGIASKEAQKQISAQMKQANVANIEQYKQILISQGTTLANIRAMLERQVISGEYLRAKIRPQIEKEICPEVIHEYYQQHLNEFQQVDRVKWQDLFIAVGPKHATMADAMQFAVQIQRRWAAGEDIAKLLEFDDGDSRFRKGAGAGEIRGDIKPRELEEYLFALKDGEFGPPKELSTGVHVYRVIKREYAGVMPFDEKTQMMIGNKLKGEMAELERRHLIRELRERALIEIEK
jgi:peptidyl-prolyl cis-trans isomerase SurA